MNNYYGITPYGALPSKRQLKHLKEFGKKAFFHFGVNTFSNMEWGNGEEAESLFNPSETDVRQWIKTIKAAGFTLAILTVKHHDGFCLWPSEYTEHTVAKSPYKGGKGDILREFTDACHEYDIAVGIYISPWDRNSKYWGSNEYSKFFNAQLTEVLSNYGKIDEVWWDGAGSTETPYDWGMWAHTIRNLQPEAVIFGSLGATPYVEMHWVGNEHGHAGDPHYPTLDAISVEKEITPEMNSGKIGGDRFIVAEVDTSIRPGWFYHKEQDYFVKSVKQLVDLWFDSIGKSAIMLLNFPPDRRGIVHELDSANAIEAHNIVSKALSVNYALEGAVKASSERCPELRSEQILNGNSDTFWCPDAEDKNPSVEITLPKERTFDTVIIGEFIELGVRIGGFTFEAEIDGKWQLITEKKSIGYKKAVHFEPVTTSKVRLTLTEFADVPLIRDFGLYSFREAGYSPIETRVAPGDKFDITTNPSVSYEYHDDGLVVMIGGLFPFNTIKFCGDGIEEFEVLAFNGTQFYSVYKGTNPAHEETVRLSETITGSYQFKLLTHRKETTNLDVHVYEY